MKRKLAIFIIFIVFCTFSLSGCAEIRGLDSFSYVIAIGFDKGTSNALKLTLQFALPSNSSSDESTSQSSDSTIISVECSSFDSGINLVNSYITKVINLSHCKVVVFSETLAYEGISEHLYSILNNVDIRPTCNVLVSRTTAEEFLNKSKPVLETHTARYYDAIRTTNRNTGYAEDLNLFDFFSDYKGSFVQATATLVGVNFDATHSTPSNTPDIDLDSSYEAGETPITAKLEVENMGTAVFYDDKLVGELNGIETVCYLLCSNKFHHATISIVNPLKENSQVTLYISQDRKTKNEVDIVNGSPFISTNISLRVNILSADIDSDFSTSDSFYSLEQFINHYFQEQISAFLYKTAKSFNSDIVGFGENIRKDYLFIDDINKVNWLRNYQNSFFECHVDTTLESGLILLRT